MSPRAPAIVGGGRLAPAVPEIPRRHEFGDTKYRQVTYDVVATTRFADCFPFASEPEEGEAPAGPVRPVARRSTPRTVDVLNSARPAAPKVLYVVPTFGWERRKVQGGEESTRSGGGLRVYLERPWFSSGDGELLGVVLPGAARVVAGGGQPTVTMLVAGGGGAGTQAGHVTQMGADPIRAHLVPSPSSPARTRPRRSARPSRTT